MGEDHTDLGAVGETLLTPLYAKANAHQVVSDVGFHDPLAAQLLERAGHDPDRVLTDGFNVAGTVHRTLVFDDLTVAFAAAHPAPQILSVGIGLCTRHARLAERVPEATTWIGVDTAEVVELRARLLPEDPVAMHAGDLRARGWAAALDGDRPTLVLAEGVLMYLDRAALATFLTEVREHFGPGTQVAGDFFHPKVAASDRHPIVKATGARFLSGARNGSELASVVPGYRLVAELPVMERIGFAQRLVANGFRIVTLGGRIYAIAQLEVTGGAGA